MSLAICWDPAALHTFYRLHPTVAAAVDRAIIRFAETGEGHLEWEPPYHWLHAGSHSAILAIDRKARTLAVLRVYRARR